MDVQQTLEVRLPIPHPWMHAHKSSASGFGNRNAFSAMGGHFVLANYPCWNSSWPSNNTAVETPWIVLVVSICPAGIRTEIVITTLCIYLHISFLTHPAHHIWSRASLLRKIVPQRMFSLTGYSGLFEWIAGDIIRWQSSHALSLRATRTYFYLANHNCSFSMVECVGWRSRNSRRRLFWQNIQEYKRLMDFRGRS